MVKDDIEKILSRMPQRSAWQRGVRETAKEMLESLEDQETFLLDEKKLLNGADDWHEWAWRGCGLIYDADIAARYCCPSELKKTRAGELPPNSREGWLDVEARAAFQARSAILRAVSGA